MYLGADSTPKEHCRYRSYGAVWGRKERLRPMICCIRRKLISCSVWQARRIQSILYSLPTDNYFFFLVHNPLPPTACAIEPHTARATVLRTSALRNWKLLCTIKHSRSPWLSPVTWLSQQVKAVHIYLRLELEHSNKTAAIPFEIVISLSLSPTVNTHVKWHHLGQHLDNILSYVSYNLAAPPPFFPP